MTENHFFKLGRKAKFLKFDRNYTYLYYTNPETGKNEFVKKVKHFCFYGRVPIYDETGYCVNSTHINLKIDPEETKIRMNVFWCGEHLISQNEFKKMCLNKNFHFTTKQIDEFKLIFERQQKEKEIALRMEKLEGDFTDEENDEV